MIAPILVVATLLVILSVGLIGVVSGGSKSNVLKRAEAQLRHAQCHGTRGVFIERHGRELRGTFGDHRVKVGFGQGDLPYVATSLDAEPAAELARYFSWAEGIGRFPEAVSAILPDEIRVWFDVAVTGADRRVAVSDGKLFIGTGPAFLNDAVSGLSRATALAAALSELPPLPVALAEYLNSDQLPLREDALRYLSRAPRGGIVTRALESCLTDEQPYRRALAMLGLGEPDYSLESVEATLLEGLGEGWSPSGTEVILLGEIGTVRAVPTLRALERRFPSARRRTIVEAIASIQARAQGSEAGSLAIWTGVAGEGALEVVNDGELALLGDADDP